MVGAREVGALLFTRSALLVQQNADTSLSCHHNNTASEWTKHNSGVAANLQAFGKDKQQSPVPETHQAPDSDGEAS